MQKVAAELGITLPKAGTYAVGNLFLPQDDTRRAELKVSLATALTDEGLTVLGFREVPIRPDEANIGPAARDAMPFIEQIIVGGGSDTPGDHSFDHALYLSRKTFTGRAKISHPGQQVYVCSLNSQDHRL